MTGGLTLSELLARNLSLLWYEGVAIVRGVVAALPERHHGDSPALPELHQIELMADGSITVTGIGPAHEPVRRLGQLLQATLSDTNVPVQLRLVVSQATAPMPSYASISEFDAALAYFERPDRGTLLKALVEKAAAIGPAAANVVLALDDLAPLPDLAPVITPRYRPRLSMHRAIVAVARLVAVLALSGGAALYLRQDRSPAGERTVAGAAVEAANALSAAVVAGVSAVSERAVGLLVPGKTAAAKSPPSEVPVAAKRKIRPAVRVAVHADEDLTPALPPRAMLIFDESDEIAAAGPDSAIGGTSTPGTDAPFDSTIYTSAAADVSPPIDVRPRLPRQLPDNADVDKLSRIELIVARDGSVESAKLLGNRPDVQGGMFLSAAKSWVYRPATKDGVAVRYRKLILVCFE